MSRTVPPWRTDPSMVPRSSVMVTQDEAEYIQEWGRCWGCGHLVVLHVNMRCLMCDRDDHPGPCKDLR